MGEVMNSLGPADGSAGDRQNYSATPDEPGSTEYHLLAWAASRGRSSSKARYSEASEEKVMSSGDWVTPSNDEELWVTARCVGGGNDRTPR